jgi:hypothetical protein
MIGSVRSSRLRLAGAALLGHAWFVPSTGLATPRDEDLFLRAEDMHTVLFGSLDAGRSTFLNAGVKRTLTGPLDRSGFVAMETNGLGVTRERSYFGSGLKVERITTEVASLLGYQWAGNGIYTALYAGPELHQEQLTIAAQAGRWSKPRIGFRGQAELWANPTGETLVTATLVAGTTRGSIWGRVSAGYRVWRNLYVGPEVITYVTESYRETKIGGHLTGLDLGILHFRVSGGIQRDDAAHAPSPYIAVTSWMRL